MELLSDVQGLAAILTGITPRDVDVTPSFELRHIADPPPQSVDLVLSHYLGLKRHVPIEKMRWMMVLSYRGRGFMLTWRKMAGFCIAVEGETEDAHPDLNSLLKKLKAAVACIAKHLETVGNEAVKSDEFFLDNSSTYVGPYFRHYLEKLDSAIAEAASPPRDDKGEGLDGASAVARLFRSALRPSYDIHYVGPIALSLFISYLEGFLEVCLALRDPRPMKLEDFRNLTWAEKCQVTLPIAEDPTIKRVYDEIHYLKRAIRDPLLHGFAQADGLLITGPANRLFPARTWDPHMTMRKQFLAFDETMGRRVSSAASAFFGWIGGEQEYEAYLRIYESGMPIPFSKSETARIQAVITGGRAEVERFCRGFERAKDDYMNFE